MIIYFKVVIIKIGQTLLIFLTLYRYSLSTNICASELLSFQLFTITCTFKMQYILNLSTPLKVNGT